MRVAEQQTLSPWRNFAGVPVVLAYRHWAETLLSNGVLVISARPVRAHGRPASIKLNAYSRA